MHRNRAQRHRKRVSPEFEHLGQHFVHRPAGSCNFQRPPAGFSVSSRFLDHFWAGHAVSRYVTLARIGHLPPFLRSTDAETIKNVNFALSLGNPPSLRTFRFNLMRFVDVS